MGPGTACPWAATPQMGVPSGFIPGASAGARAAMLVLVARYCAWSQGTGAMGMGATGAGGGAYMGIGCGGGRWPHPLHAVAASAMIKPQICFVAILMSRVASIE